MIELNQSRAKKENKMKQRKVKEQKNQFVKTTRGAVHYILQSSYNLQAGRMASQLENLEKILTEIGLLSGGLF